MQRTESATLITIRGAVCRAGIALALCLAVTSCKGGGDKPSSASAEPGTTLDQNARLVLDELLALETKKDVTCWTSFRQLDWFIAEKPFSELGTLAKTKAIKQLTRAAWARASARASGPAITAVDIDAAVALPEISMGARQSELATFANDIGIQNYTDYQKTAEHLRVVLALLFDEIYLAGDGALKPMTEDGLRRLADASTTLSLMLLKGAGQRADRARSQIVEGEHVSAAAAAIAKEHRLPASERPRRPLPPEQAAARLQPLTDQLIEGKVKALASFNKTSSALVDDVNRVSRVPLSAEAVDFLTKDLQSFVHFVAAGFEPMRADNYLSDGSFAPTKMPRLAYLDDTRVQNVVMQLFPHHIRTNGDVEIRYEPNPGPTVPFDRKPIEILLLDHEQNGIRDSAIQWVVMANVFKEKPFAMDPFAAEYLSEVVSMMMTLYVRRGEMLAKESGAKEIGLDIVRRIRSKAYVLVPPHGPEAVEWNEERMAKKKALLAAYRGPLFADVTRAAGLEIKPKGEAPGSVAGHGVDGHGVEAHGVGKDPKGATKDPKAGGVEAHGVEAHGVQSVQGHFDIQKMMGGGLAVGDVDGDGYPDLFFAGVGLGKLMLNRGKAKPGSFTDATSAWGVPGDLDDSHGSLFFDADGDGDLDLLVLRSLNPSLLLRNDGGKFTDVASEVGLKTHRGAQVAVIFDSDGDGDLDIYIGYYGNHKANMGESGARSLPALDGRNGSPNQLWRRGADGKYTEVAAAAGVADTGWTLALGAFDYDVDGDLDLYLANDFGANKLYRNEGKGKFSDATEETRTGDRGSGMNVDFADVNGDSRWDIYVTNIDMFSKRIKVIFPTDETTIKIDEPLTRAVQYLSGNKLYVSSAGSSFTAEEGARFEPGDRGWGWDAAFFDYENDGDEDIYITNGWIDGSYAGNQKNQMFLNDEGFFYQAPPSSAEAFAGNTRAASAVDVDLDGDLDLVTNQFHQSPRVLENRQRSGNRWLKLWLRGKAPNTGAVGAVVTVKVGDKTMRRQVTCGRGYLSQADGSISLGTGDAKTVDATIRWPDGREQKLSGLATNKIHEIKQ
jgi:hypothetical protein